MPHRTITGNDDDALVATVVAAVKAFEAADAVKKEKALKLGELLAEAQKRHPTDRAFEAFLTRAGGIQIRRAKDLISIALGRKEFDKHQSDNAAAQRRLRHRRKAEKIEREKAKAALPTPEPKPDPKSEAHPKPDALRNASPEPGPKPDAASTRASGDNLYQFLSACRAFLPRLNKTDLAKAQAFVASYGNLKTEKAA